LFLTVQLKFNSVFTLSGILFLIFLSSGCVKKDFDDKRSDLRPPELQNTFTLPVQKAPPENVQAITFHKAGEPGTPPIIELNSDQKLSLEFDYLKREADQFTVKVSHYNADWSKSGLLPSNILTANFQDYISIGTESRVQDPAYSSFSFQFPNNHFGIAVSGNYLLEVYQTETEELLFSLPFFVYENEGQLQSEVEVLFNLNELPYRKVHQLFSVYRYPKFIRIPRVNLSYYYIQNQFWGRAKKVEIFDDMTPGAIHFHIARERSFNATYSFFELDLRDFNIDGERIRDVFDEYTPTRILLYRDVINLSDLPVFISRSRFGRPDRSRFARYADVRFRLDPSNAYKPGDQIYVVGDFNSWTLNPKNRLTYDTSTKLFEGNALVKQGEYSYKYVILNRQQNRVDDVLLDDIFGDVSQNYTVFVYFEDPDNFFTRLLAVEHFRAN